MAHSAPPSLILSPSATESNPSVIVSQCPSCASRTSSSLSLPTSQSKSSQPSPSSSLSSCPSPVPSSKNSASISSDSEPPTPVRSSSPASNIPIQRAERSPRPFVQQVSEAEGEWQRVKSEDLTELQESVKELDSDELVQAMDELMELVALEKVKEQFLDVLSQVEISALQQADMKKQRFHAVFQGNPGTGKTTVARLYARFLYAIGVLTSDVVKETSGAKLAYRGPQYVDDLIKKIITAGGGVLFVDEAYQLASEHTTAGGLQALDIMLTEMENNIGKLVVVFVGYNKEMEAFFKHNPGLSSRIPYILQFEDLTTEELWRILSSKIEQRYAEKPEVEGGIDGLYMRIATRRLASGRGKRGFGNARAVENLVTKISQRQTRRLKKEKAAWRKDKEGVQKPKYNEFTKEDLIGPNPSDVIFESAAWKELQGLVGLEEVKSAASTLFDTIQTNYLRELEEQEPLKFSLNRIFVGSPGTGKTTVAKLYGQILADLGLLSSGEVVLKNPTDFIGSCLGKSEANTRGILAATVGKVLVIDEAYMLGPMDEYNKPDQYRTAVVDTLVAEVQNVAGDDRCILLLGYEGKIRDMFRAVNPGFSRRFAVDNAFRFVDYNFQQLTEILHLKLKKHDLQLGPNALQAALTVLGRSLLRPNFSNASEVDLCLDTAKMNYQTRQSKLPLDKRAWDGVLEPIDLDPDFNRLSDIGATCCRRYLGGKVSENIIARLEEYQNIAKAAKENGSDPRGLLPTRFIFKGPAGTGKTTTALSMGQLFYDMGFLSSPEVVECSAADLIGEYVGHTSPKTKRQLEKALGKVLFIDEAYRLKDCGYSSEAINEMIYLLSQPRFLGKIIVILAGHTRDMDDLRTTRPNLSTFFPEDIVFENIQAQDSMRILQRELTEQKVTASFLMDPKSEGSIRIMKWFSLYRQYPSWANAKDIKTLAQQMARAAYAHHVASRGNAAAHGSLSGDMLSLPLNPALDCMTKMFEQHRSRASEHAKHEAANQALIKMAYKLQPNCPLPPTAVDTELTTDGIAKFDIGDNAEISLDASESKDKKKAESDENKSKEKKKEETMGQYLGRLGPCPAGFAWHEEGTGWRCDGGSHFMSGEQVAKLQLENMP